MKNQVLVFFDGQCHICSGLVNFILKIDKKQLINFSALQSLKGEKLLKDHGIQHDMNSIFVLRSGQVDQKSEAVFIIAEILGWPWKGIKIFKFLGPKINDSLYDVIAKNRYRWFGKKESCMIENKKFSSRFIN